MRRLCMRHRQRLRLRPGAVGPAALLAAATLRGVCSSFSACLCAVSARHSPQRAEAAAAVVRWRLMLNPCGCNSVARCSLPSCCREGPSEPSAGRASAGDGPHPAHSPAAAVASHRLPLTFRLARSDPAVLSSLSECMHAGPALHAMAAPLCSTPPVPLQ
ncbi:hypothetical protein FA09DRAFT_252479 [Tilletiopsis washingtonensis]|uniref:Uncharacterized protein n=1 Tax=Tilletiopsis washingtonensis TaxID=58919 RepID=A0A316ZAU0_9BASI|nr:hypothetical protein FA09DRAFT_252479 [Tilletiopsis washingtonensis]PWN98810.1 hypothetical protein FA09DRAFT_252479 [Tilletiopsis washingtonensis]